MAMRSEQEIREFLENSKLSQGDPPSLADVERSGGWMIIESTNDVLNWVLGEPTNPRFQEQIVDLARDTAAKIRRRNNANKPSG